MLAELPGDARVGRGLVDAVDLEGGGVEVEGLLVVATAGGLGQQALQRLARAVRCPLLRCGSRSAPFGRASRTFARECITRARRSSRPGFSRAALRYSGSCHGDVDEPGAEIGLHDAVREAHAVAAGLHQPERHAPGRRQPDVERAAQPSLDALLIAGTPARAPRCSRRPDPALLAAGLRARTRGRRT